MSPNQASSLVLVVLGGVFMFLASRLGLGSAKHIGPGFTSFWAAAVLSGLGVVVFARDLIAVNAAERKRVGQLWAGLNWKNPPLLLFAMLVYILVYKWLGFILSSTLLLLALFCSLKPVRFWRDAAVAVLGSVITFAIFDLWLKVVLPHQALEKLLISLRDHLV